jgi:hypothetical protein
VVEMLEAWEAVQERRNYGFVCSGGASGGARPGQEHIFAMQTEYEYWKWVCALAQVAQGLSHHLALQISGGSGGAAGG